MKRIHKIALITLCIFWLIFVSFRKISNGATTSEFAHESVESRKRPNVRPFDIPSYIPSEDPDFTLSAFPLTPNSTLQAAETVSFFAMKHKAFIPNTQIPLIIHQTWSVTEIRMWHTPLHVVMSVSSWRSMNAADAAYILWDDASINEFIAKYHPELQQLFQSLPKQIMRIDLFRYLVVQTFGGVYSDADTQCLKEIKSWVTPADLEPWSLDDDTLMDFRHLLVNMIVGIETDVDADFGTMWKLDYVSPLQISQWTFGASPNNAYLTAILDYVVKNIKAIPDLSKAKTLDVAGPFPWTRAIHKLWFDWGVEAELLRNFGDQAIQIERMLVLPITAFSPDPQSIYGNMGAKGIRDASARVHHLAKGTWKS